MFDQAGAIMDAEISISRTLAPEDIRPDMFVVIQDYVEEYLPEWSLTDPHLKGDGQPLRFRFLPCDCPGCGHLTPMKVSAVGLPFVLVKTIKGAHRTIDVRRYRLAQLPDHYGRKVFKKLKAAAQAVNSPPKPMVK